MEILVGKKNLERETYRDIRSMLQASIRKFPDFYAYSFYNRDRTQLINKSYQDLLDDINCFGTGVLQLGTELWQERVSVMGENSYGWVVAHVATLFGLGVAVPMDKLLEEEELVGLMERGQTTIFVTDNKQLSKAKDIAARLDQLKYIIVIDPSDDFEKLQEEDGRFLKFTDLMASGKRALDAGDKRFIQTEIELDRLAALLFTSGTTDTSKGVMLSHANLISNINQGIETIALEPGTKALSVLPLHHALESTVGMFCLWSGGVCICINDSLRYLADNICKWQIKMIIVVPVMLEKIYRRIIRTAQKEGKLKQLTFMRKFCRFMQKLGIDLRPLAFKKIHQSFGGELKYLVSGAAPLSVEIHEFLNDIGFECWTGYGLTEAAPMLASCCQAINQPGSVGKALAHIELAIDNGLDYSDPDHCGEILARGGNIMMGYYQDPVANELSFTEDGWLRTGDLGYFKDECLYITGRVKSVIVLDNGKNIFPEELEFLLNQLEAVDQSMVWGQRLENGSQVICARLQVDPRQLAGKKDLTEQADYLAGLIQQINKELPSFKQIRYFVWSKEPMIMTTTLKVKRQQELERIEAELDRRELTVKTGHKTYLEFSS